MLKKARWSIYRMQFSAAAIMRRARRQREEALRLIEQAKEHKRAVKPAGWLKKFKEKIINKINLWRAYAKNLRTTI